MVQTLSIKLQTLVAVLWLAINSTAYANLIDRGNGLIYDQDLNITWLADANLATSNTFGVSGIDPSGKMDWDTTQNWLAAMNAENYKGSSNWRLPYAPSIPIHYELDDRDRRLEFQFDIEEHEGQGQVDTELGHLFYNELDGQGGGQSFPDHSANFSLFRNVVGTGYRAGANFPSPNASNLNWIFYFKSGEQQRGTLNIPFNAWPVASGDIAAVPVPSAAWFLLTGLISLVGWRQRNKG